jgi:hypothetical protein
VLLKQNDASGQELLQQIGLSARSTPTVHVESLDGEGETGSDGGTDDDLARERSELQHQEDSYMAARKASVSRAMGIITDPGASDAARQENMNVRWRAAHDAYEQAAYNDIRNEMANVTDISEEGQKHFDDLSKESEEVMGVSEYADLLNASYQADKERMAKWKGLMAASVPHPTTLHQVLNSPKYSEWLAKVGDEVQAKENFLYRAGGMLALQAGETATVLSVDQADGELMYRFRSLNMLVIYV